MSQKSSLHLGATNTLRTNATFESNNNNNNLNMYASHTERNAHQNVWLEMAVFSAFPKTPSLFARELQEGKIYFQKKEDHNNNNEYEVVYQNQQEEADDLLQTHKKAYYYDNTIKQEHLLTVFKIEIELFNDECPVTCANFYQLCEPENVRTHNETFNNNNNSNNNNTNHNVFFQDTTYNLTNTAAKNDTNFKTQNDQNPAHNNATKIFEHKDIMPSYKGTFFHKIIPKLIAQGGDITLHVTTYGANFLHTEGGRPNYLNNQKNVQKMKDESKKKRFDEVGLLGMANSGPDSNASQFFILTDTNLSNQNDKTKSKNNKSSVGGGNEAPRSAFNFYNTNRNDVHNVNNKDNTSLSNEKNLNGKFTCFGKVVKNLDVFLKYVSTFGNVEGYPSRFVIITDCGIGSISEEEEEENNNNNNNNNIPLSEQQQQEREVPEDKVRVVEQSYNNNNNEEEGQQQQQQQQQQQKDKLKSSIKQKEGAGNDAHAQKKDKHVSYKQ